MMRAIGQGASIATQIFKLFNRGEVNGFIYDDPLDNAWHAGLSISEKSYRCALIC